MVVEATSLEKEAESTDQRQSLQASLCNFVISNERGTRYQLSNLQESPAKKCIATVLVLLIFIDAEMSGSRVHFSSSDVSIPRARSVLDVSVLIRGSSRAVQSAHSTLF